MLLDGEKTVDMRDITAMEMIKHKQGIILEGQNNLRSWLYTIVLQNVIIILQILVLTLIVSTK